MQINIDDFFIPDNEVKLPEELDYSRVVEIHPLGLGLLTFHLSWCLYNRLFQAAH